MNDFMEEAKRAGMVWIKKTDTRSGHWRKASRRPRLAESAIWCDFHCEIHPCCDEDYYECGETDCNPENWRPVYVLGERGEVF